MLDPIWFTYKARIRAQERLSQNDLHSQALLVWYAVIGTCLAIVALRFPKCLGENTDVMTAIFSVAIFAFSMLVTNRDFRGRSLGMRLNYLAIHELYQQVFANQNNKETLSQIESEYHGLLSSVENHASIDDKYFRVFHVGKLTSRQPTTTEKMEVYAYLVSRLVLLTTLYVAPITAIFILL